MHATFEPLSGVVRVHEDKDHLETYSWACTVTVDLHAGEIKLYGAMRAPTFSEAKAIKNLFLSMDLTKAKWERVSADSSRQTTLGLKGSRSKSEK